MMALADSSSESDASSKLTALLESSNVISKDETEQVLQETFCPSQKTAEGGRHDAYEDKTNKPSQGCHNASGVRGDQGLAVADGGCCHEHQPGPILHHRSISESVGTRSIFLPLAQAFAR